MAKKKGLGRGLSALMADVAEAPEQPVDQVEPSAAKRSDLVVPIEKISPNPDQINLGKRSQRQTLPILQAPFVKKVLFSH